MQDLCDGVVKTTLNIENQLKNHCFGEKADMKYIHVFGILSYLKINILQFRHFMF